MPRQQRPRRASGIKLPKIDLDKLKLPKLNLDRLPKLPVRQVVIALVLGVLALIMLNLNSRLNEYNRLTAQRDRVGVEVTQLAATSTVLDTQLAYAQSDEAVEVFAREAHMVKTDEVLIVPLPKPGQATPTPQSKEETIRTVENWEVWWALFFD